MNSSARPADLNLANWDLGGPVSEWSYQHTDKLFPTERLVPAMTASPTTQPIATDAPPELAHDLESGRVHGITILAGGQAVFRWPQKPAGPHLLMSVSKVFVSLAIGILVDQGKLDYTDAVRDYLPELGEQWEPCLVQHLLDMTSGVDCPEVGDPGAYSDPEHPFYQFEASLGWRPAGRSVSPYDLVLGYN